MGAQPLEANEGTHTGLLDRGAVFPTPSHCSLDSQGPSYWPGSNVLRPVAFVLVGPALLLRGPFIPSSPHPLLLPPQTARVLVMPRSPWALSKLPSGGRPLGPGGWPAGSRGQCQRLGLEEGCASANPASAPTAAEPGGRASRAWQTRTTHSQRFLKDFRAVCVCFCSSPPDRRLQMSLGPTPDCQWEQSKSKTGCLGSTGGS